MKSIEEKQKDRFDFIKAIYDQSNGSQQPINTINIGETLGFEEKYRQDIFQYLVDECLINEHVGGIYRSARLTHFGIKEVEAALSNPDQPTEHFPPKNLTVINNSITQNGDGNTATIKNITQEEKHAYETLVPLLHQFLQELDQEREIRAELEAEVITMEAQLNSPKPKYLKEIGKSIRTILEGIAVAAITQGPLFQKILRSLPH